MGYDTLEPQKIVDTIDTLGKRIKERFPKSGISNVCDKLLLVANNAKERSEWISRPIVWLRCLVWLGIATFVGVCAYAIYAAISDFRDHNDHFLANLDVVTNVMFLLGGLILFIWTTEVRYKRNRALAAIHELRAIAHIIDMHQLTKDPEKITLKQPLLTPSSPKMTMTVFELKRYLDYCSEMLALTGKVAAVYVQNFDDSVALASASEVEALTTGLSRKIWQKLLILSSISDNGPIAQAKIETP